MSFNPNDSAIRVDRDLEDKLAGASFEEIKAHLANAAIQQGLVVPDVYDSSVLLPTALADAAPKKFAKTVVVNGTKHIIEGDSPEALVAAEANFYRQTFAEPAETTRTEQPRNDRGQFTAEPNVTPEQKASLTLQFQLGQIDIDTYLQQSGAIDSYLANQGVDVDSLREVSSQKFEHNWQSGTDAFKTRHPEWDAHYASDANLHVIGNLLIDNNMLDSANTADALEAAYKFAVENELLTQTRESQLVQKISEINDPYTLRSTLQPGSGLFGR